MSFLSFAELSAQHDLVVEAFQETDLLSFFLLNSEEAQRAGAEIEKWEGTCVHLL